MSMFDFFKTRMVDAFNNVMPRRARLRFVNASLSDNADNDSTDLTFAGGGGASLVGSAVISVTGDGTLGVGGLANADLLTAESVRLTSAANRNIYGMTADVVLGNMVPGKTITNDNAAGGFDFIFHHESSSVSGGVQNRFKVPTLEGSSYTLKPGQSLYCPYSYGSTNRWVKEADANALLDGLLVTQLSVVQGRRNREVRAINGYGAAGDGGDGLFQWVTGVSAGADGGRKVNATGGQWQRLYSATGCVNVRWFGILPDGSDCAAAVNSLITTLAAETARPVVELYFPKGSRSYRFSGPILPPAIGTGVPTKRLIVRGDRGEGQGQAAYGNAAWESTTFYSGTSLQFDAGEIGFDCWQGGDVGVSLSLRDICLQGSGSGSIAVDMFGANTSESQIRFDSEHLTTAGFEVGLRIVTYQQSRHPGLRTYGHSKHVYVAGVATCWISDSEHQGGTDAFVFQTALDMAVRGFLIQGCTGAAIKVEDVGGVGVRGVRFSDGHIETVHGQTIDDDPANAGQSVGITLDYVRVAQLTADNTFTTYGTGWCFNKSCAGMVIHNAGDDMHAVSADDDIVITNDLNAYFRFSSPRKNMLSIGLPIDLVEVGSSGVLAYDAVVAGSHAQHFLTKNMTLPAPTNMPHGAVLAICFRQNGTGGWTVTTSGMGMGTEFVLDHTGNVAGAQAWLVFTRNTNGGFLGQQCRLLYWSGWRS
jgi:hypothetical protein